MDSPQTVICTYRVRSDHEDEFIPLVRRHWPKMRELGLATEDAASIYAGRDDENRLFVVEIWSWASADAVKRAHSHPEVLALWEPMEAYCESRNGQPACEFPHVERLS